MSEDFLSKEYWLYENEEFVSQFRDYKLSMVWAKKCTKCGSGTNLHMLNFGGYAMKCSDRFCGEQMRHFRRCTKCAKEVGEYILRCSNCEPKVQELANLHLKIHDAKKKMKRVSRAYTCGKISLKEKVRIHNECKEIKKECKAKIKAFIL